MAKKLPGVPPAQVLADLKQGRFAPLYFLQGEEPYAIDQIADFIEAHALTDAEKSFNQTICYGKEVALQAVLESARRFPMGAQRQVIIVKEAQEMADLRSKAKDGPLVRLAKYAEQPQPSTVLVFCHKHKKLDGRSAVYKALLKHAVLVQTQRLYDNQLPGWIADYCKGKGYSITPKAAALLADFIGNDLARIAGEIEKVLVNFSEPVQITDELVSQYVGISKEYNNFELQSALAQRNVLKANKIVTNFAANIKGHPVIPLIGQIYNYFATVLLNHAKGQGLDDIGVGQLISKHPFIAKEYRLASRNYNLRQTLHVVGYLHEADLRSKGIGSSLPEAAILRELVYKILHC